MKQLVCDWDGSHTTDENSATLLGWIMVQQDDSRMRYSGMNKELNFDCWECVRAYAADEAAKKR